jgi:hypothetical protein
MKKIVEEYENYDPSSLWMGKSHKTLNDRYRKSQVYCDINKYKKLWIKTPFMLLPFNVSVRSTKQNTKLYAVTATLNPLTKERKKFIAFINKIDKVIAERIGETLGDDYTYCYSIDQNEKTFLKHKINLGLPKNKNGTDNYILYDKNKERKTVDDITPGTKMIGIIELFDIWIDDEEKTYQASWNIVHGKIFQDILIDENYLTDCLEDDSKININKNLGSTKEKYKIKCPNCEHKIEFTININIQGIIDNQKKQMYMPAPYHYVPSISSIPSAPIAPSFDAPMAPPFGGSNDAPSSRGFVPDLKDIMNIKNRLKKVTPKNPSSVKKSTTGRKK